MKKTITLFANLLFLSLVFLSSKGFSQNKNFYIFLCLGQSNMEGAATIETADYTVDSRFKVMESIDCSNLGRTKGNWYTAVPPLCRCYTGLTPVDYFGKTLVASLPDSITVGVVHVAVGGCKIELFDKNAYTTYLSTVTEQWFKDIVAEYGGNPYGKLIELATIAKTQGVIKGILLHQGESNTGDANWTTKVKTVYDNILSDLGLDANSVPLLAGEVVNADQNGVCSSMNPIIATLPNKLSIASVISSAGCPAGSDNLHFTAVGYRKLGWRYAAKMLSLLGYEPQIPEPSIAPLPENTTVSYYEPECATVGSNWTIGNNIVVSNKKYVTAATGLQNLTAASSATEDLLTIPITVDTTANFQIYGRVNCPSTSKDSYWIKVNNASFVKYGGLYTVGWQWKSLGTYYLTKGSHTLKISYCENGAMLDKLCVTNYTTAPTDKGETAVNICFPAAISNIEKCGYSLGQNFPNPFSTKTNIPFEIPVSSYVSLKIYSILGEEITELAGKTFPTGQHTIEFENSKLSGGYYFYTLKTDKFVATRKMFISK